MALLTNTKVVISDMMGYVMRTKRPKYLFILSHMRSRSSVLSHILGSNDGICGYSELQHSYIQYTDLMQLKEDLYDDLKCNFRGKYLLDKLLHNELVISKEVFETASPKIIFLLRTPESSIKSIVNMGYFSGMDWYRTPENALEYYCRRLEHLAMYAEIFDGDAFFLESDDLLNNTDQVLRTLTEWLNLHTSLVNRYRKFNHTGKSGCGDRSENIQTGRLIKTKGYPDIEIPPEVLQVAESSYNKCKTILCANINMRIIK